MTEIEDRWRELGAFIREQRRVGQLSLRKLSEMAGISNPYLSQIERGMRKPSAEILRQIAGALHISAETLYVRAGILDERDGEHDLVADIRRDPYIDEDQKKTLEHIYLSFRTAFLADLEARGFPVPDPGRPADRHPEDGADADVAPDGDLDADTHLDTDIDIDVAPEPDTDAGADPAPPSANGAGPGHRPGPVGSSAPLVEPAPAGDAAPETDAPGAPDPDAPGDH